MWQYIITGIIFTAAVVYLAIYARQLFRNKKDGCSKGCGCEGEKKA